MFEIVRSEQKKNVICFIFLFQLRESIAAEPVTVKAKSNKKPNVFISFEVCKSCHTYKRQAAKVFDDLSALFPDKSFEMSINEFGPPRRGAFEITVSKKKGNSSDANLLWSGLKKGPPRRLKFPEADVLSDNMAKILS